MEVMSQERRQRTAVAWGTAAWMICCVSFFLDMGGGGEEGERGRRGSSHDSRLIEEVEVGVDNYFVAYRTNCINNEEVGVDNYFVAYRTNCINNRIGVLDSAFRGGFRNLSLKSFYCPIFIRR